MKRTINRTEEKGQSGACGNTRLDLVTDSWFVCLLVCWFATRTIIVSDMKKKQETSAFWHSCLFNRTIKGPENQKEGHRLGRRECLLRALVQLAQQREREVVYQKKNGGWCSASFKHNPSSDRKNEIPAVIKPGGHTLPPSGVPAQPKPSLRSHAYCCTSCVYSYISGNMMAAGNINSKNERLTPIN